jgi:hypothetical protein
MILPPHVEDPIDTVVKVVDTVVLTSYYYTPQSGLTVELLELSLCACICNQILWLRSTSDCRLTC